LHFTPDTVVNRVW